MADRRPRNLRLHLPLGTLMGAWSLVCGYYVVAFMQAGGHPPGSIFVPFIFLGWLIGTAVVGGIWPAIAAILRPRRAKHGLDCRVCGYDLSGSISAAINRCPECGTNIDLRRAA